MKLLVLGAGTLLAVFVCGPSIAQETGERSWAAQRLPAPARAFELSVGGGYTQGFGSLQSGTGFPSVARGGFAPQLGLGYRIDPHWGVGISFQYQHLQSERADAARGLSATLLAQYHLSPHARFNPWVELGTGYRFLWEPMPTSDTVLTQGLQLVRARVGLDVRTSSRLAFGPFIGADLTMFMWQDLGDNQIISDPRLSTFVLAGMQSRFDIGGTKVSTTSPTTAELR
jgi:hypothetical protein